MADAGIVGHVEHVNSQGTLLFTDQVIESYRDFVGFLDHINAVWVDAARRMSPRVLVELHGLTGPEVARLFAPFARAEAHRTQPGIGLGLALARSWARQLGGDLTAAPGPGGRFRLTIPTRTA